MLQTYLSQKQGQIIKFTLQTLQDLNPPTPLQIQTFSIAKREKESVQIKSCYNSHDRDVGCAQNVWGYFCYTSLKSTLIHMFLCNKDFVPSSTQ